MTGANVIGCNSPCANAGCPNAVGKDHRARYCSPRCRTVANTRASRRRKGLVARNAAEEAANVTITTLKAEVAGLKTRLAAVNELHFEAAQALEKLRARASR